MNERENLAVDTAEKVEVATEQTTEQIGEPVVEQVEIPAGKTYTEEEFKEAVKQQVDQVLGKKIARNEAKIRREYDRKYGRLESVLKAGTGKESVEEMTDSFAQFYESKGVKIPSAPQYSEKDIRVLADAEAAEIIKGGYDEVVEEVDRLAGLGVEKMTPRERAVFKALAEHRQTAEKERELVKIGVSADVYGSKEFKDFAAKFDSKTPITEIYGIYSMTQPKKEVETMGSMKGGADKAAVKDFYTPEEAKKFTREELRKNPQLFAAVEKSMQKW